MTRKEQNKILDAKIESNVNQYKVDRLNAEISAFSSGDLNKYEFLKRIDLNYKPNALFKVRFQYSPFGETFNTGLDKNAQRYQEEGIIKLLKDIRDSLAGGIIPRVPGASGGPRRFRNDDNDDGDNNMPNLETDKEAAKTNILNKIDSFDKIVKNKEKEFDKMFKDKENRLNKLNNNVKKNKKLNRRK